MDTIRDYIKKYGKYTFLEKEFNEVDNVILSALSYVKFKGIVPGIGKGTIRLSEASDIFFSKYKRTDITSSILAVRKASYLLKELAKSKRYKDLILLNYEYKLSSSIQFGALTIKLPNNRMYISFEGTDSYISGWKEDFLMYSTFPVDAQKEAINYINKVVSIFGPRVYIGGHSKGGNLALVSSMYCKRYVLNKIVKIYSNDGPGLREKEYLSFRYNFIRNKYVHIIPEEGVVGLLYRNEDNYVIIKSSNKKFFQHDLNTWLVNGDKFYRGKMSTFSKRFGKTINTWLDNMTMEGTKKVLNLLSLILEKAEVKDLMEIKKEKLKKIIKIYKEAKNIDPESKKLLSDCFKDLYQEWRS